MTQVVFDDELFREQFPEFKDETVFPTSRLQMYWDMAICYINDNTDCTNFTVSQLTLAINLMTAHLTALSVLIAAGQSPIIVQGSTIDKITVTLVPPPVPNQWRWWLSTTPYGAQLLALLQVISAGGLYVGGLPEGQAFRKFAGIF